MSIVRDLDPSKIETFDQLLTAWTNSGGFQAPNIDRAALILANSIKDPKCLKFLSFPAAIIATGARGLISYAIRHRLIDVIITTCGTVDHDLARTYASYELGAFEDSDLTLAAQHLHRLGSVRIPAESYGPTIERVLERFLPQIYDVSTSRTTEQICAGIGRLMWEEGHHDSLLALAYRHQIPVFLPGPTDGALGSALWQFGQNGSKIFIDLLEDSDRLANLIFDHERTSALCLGGGISKHHTIWWNQFKEGLDYLVYITTANEYNGSLSGARDTEAITWNKLRPNAEYTTVHGEITIVLPLIILALRERLQLHG